MSFLGRAVCAGSIVLPTAEDGNDLVVGLEDVTRRVSRVSKEYKAWSWRNHDILCSRIGIRNQSWLSVNFGGQPVGFPRRVLRDHRFPVASPNVTQDCRGDLIKNHPSLINSPSVL